MVVCSRTFLMPNWPPILRYLLKYSVWLTPTGTERPLDLVALEEYMKTINVDLRSVTTEISFPINRDSFF